MFPFQHIGCLWSAFRAFPATPLVHALIVIMYDKSVWNVINLMRERVKKINPSSLSGKDKRLVYPGIALFSSKKAAEEFFWDIKLYMEACSTPNSAAEALLITNDKHHFFCFFQLSKIMIL